MVLLLAALTSVIVVVVVIVGGVESHVLEAAEYSFHRNVLDFSPYGFCIHA